ncbi:probable phenylalanine--tRNA ligase, mitochondrial [Culicoides brevitarsis]|uniref:probable phenylalanine--tRNA ligase, mitochondrial n=1 Tax=Culicoides brevitarsis TaxID=469753 RepID=UPI00307B202B
MLKLLRASPNFRAFSTIVNPSKNTVSVGGVNYEADNFTNITEKILSYNGRNLHLQKNHPLSILRQKIVNYFYTSYLNNKGNPLFSVYDSLSPIVSVQQNFDNLLIPKDHPSRAKGDCYYINQNFLFRGHTTAHQVDLIRSGLDNFLIVGDVYRRDEIDSTHYPVFHQIDGVRIVHRDKLFGDSMDLEIFEQHYKTNLNKNIPPEDLQKCIDQNKQPNHTLEAVKVMEHELKQILSELAKTLFGSKIECRWVDTHFPFTQPSWELEILHKGKWIEVLGCGIMRDEILQNTGVTNSIGYAFGLGLERLAMILFDIPDIRLFWSRDSGFLSQFDEKKPIKKMKYKPVSSFPQCPNDISFWLPETMDLEAFPANDLFDMARDIGGDVIEQISLKDKFTHPKTGKSSLCYKIVYRHMERTLTQEEVNEIHKKIGETLAEKLGVVIR